MNRPRYQPADLSRLRTYSVDRRPHKVSTAALAGLPEPGASAADLLASLPDVLGVREFRATVDAIVAAVRDGRPVVLAMGAHVVKVGCTPIVVDLIRRGIVSAVACNGAFAIHDMELATIGATSEEVADTIRDGSFGMVSETLEFFARAAARADERQIGFGEAVGGLLVEANPPGLAHSVLAAAYQASIPATLHVALGTDTVHASGAMDGARIGAASLRDFRLICSVVGDLGAVRPDGAGGVWLNVGSAVVMPEVFLKAVSVARNLGANLDAMTTANFDMLRHYRPKVNVVTRPVTHGRGHEVIGHHEILLPLLRAALLERLSGPGAVS
ncbi:MAG: hypothetical protein JXB13_21580, partial [Phycisphaerae bacterium]|nr:hypothetical protein [Phycisphaerae bacterium]